MEEARMEEERKYSNPFSLGLTVNKLDSSSEYFYREILVRKPTDSPTNSQFDEEEDIDVVDGTGHEPQQVSKIEPLDDVSLILVCPQISTSLKTIDNHAHEDMFRSLSPIFSYVENVELKFDEDEDARTLTHKCLAMIRDSVRELVKQRPNDHVFLAGWGISSLLSMQAIQKVEGIAGVLNFGFPLKSHFGFRGSVDDTICVSYCPSLFVIGELAKNVNLKDLQLLREYMICESGLIVVGGADDHLRVCPLFLSVEQVTQESVDRVVLEQVVEFVRQIIDEGGLSAHERREHLKPVELPSPFDVDVTILKGRASGFMPRAGGQSETRKRKKK